MCYEWRLIIQNISLQGGKRLEHRLNFCKRIQNVGEDFPIYTLV